MESHVPTRPAFDQIRRPFGNRIDRRTNMCCREIRYDTSINYTQSFHAIDREVRTNHTSVFLWQHRRCSRWMRKRRRK
jgi:hypothetical protein